MDNESLLNLIHSKKGYKKQLAAWTLKDICILILGSMFTYKNLPESIPEEFMERFLIVGGSAAVWRLDDPDAKRYKGELIVSPGCNSDEPDAYGIGYRFIATTLNGYVKELLDADAAVGRNNSLYNSDMPIVSAVCSILTEMFTSLNTNIIYSRLKPIFKVSTDEEKAAVEEAFRKIKDDLEPIQVTSQNVLSMIEGAEDIKILDITDVKNADKLQYIIKAIDDMIRWFYTYYAGQAIQGNSKLAQQTVDEVQGTTSTSFILPNDRLKQRRRWVDKINRLFGTDIQVDFSDAWKTESLKYKKEADLDEDGTVEELEKIEETNTETVKETDPETVKETDSETEKKTEDETE